MDAPRRTTLIAAWPGVGQVGVVCASFLVEKLGFEPVENILDPEDCEPEVEGLPLHDGVVRLQAAARHQLLARRTAAGRQLILLSSAPECVASFRTSLRLLRCIGLQELRRVVFLGGAVLPPAEGAPRLYSACTSERTQGALFARSSVRPLPAPYLRGTAAKFLGAALAVGVEGAALLAAVPACAGFNAFLPGAEALRQEIEPLLEAESRTSLDTLEAEIEGLFALSRTDRTEARRLKQLLDVHDLFSAYEDRFLDLFSPRSS